MPTYFVPAQDELSSSVERVVLPGNEDYQLKVLEITEQTKNDFNGKPQDVFVVKFEVQSFADGAELEDTSGNPIEGNAPWIWKDIDPARMGFKTDGTASIARQFFCAVNGIADLTERVPEGDTDELVGRTVIGTIIVYKKRDGTFGNKVNAFKTPGRRRGRSAASTEAADAPVKPANDDIDPAYLAAVAALVSDEDDPSEAVVEEVKTKLRGGRKTKAESVEDNLDDLPF